MLQYKVVFNKGELKSDYLGEDIYNLLDKTFQIPDSFEFRIFEVSGEYIARPDLIAYDAYNDTQYTDLICKLNGISNPFELNEGRQILLPVSNDIHKFYVRPPIEEREGDEVVPVPKPAQKQSKKRKANEAIIGDRRFKIDANNGIIIY